MDLLKDVFESDSCISMEVEDWASSRSLMGSCDRRLDLREGSFCSTELFRSCIVEPSFLTAFVFFDSIIVGCASEDGMDLISFSDDDSAAGKAFTAETPFDCDGDILGLDDDA